MLSAGALERQIRQGIPIATGMAFRVEALSPGHIRVRGGGAENVNVHGTAFAGSLYAVCTLALWGLVRSRLPADATLVLAEAAIRYHRPVRGDILADCRIPAEPFESFLAALHADGRARLNGEVLVPGGEALAASYQGSVHARLAQP